MPAPPLVWTEPYRIRATEVGPDERATVLALADLLQEAAGEHARATDREGFDLSDGGRGTWALSRLRIVLDRRPAMLEPVTVTTWPSAYDGARVHRDFVMEDEGGAACVRATSVWFVFDVARRRAVRLPPPMRSFGPAERARALTPGAAPSPPVEAEAERRFAVRHADLDRVGHANNVRYVEWALEAAGGADGLREVDVAYRAEAVYGDTVVSQVGPLRDGARRHAILRESDGRTLATARTLWDASP